MIVDDIGFNSVFISYSHKDAAFAQRFRQALQEKLRPSVHVWMDESLSSGKVWLKQLNRRLNTTALVIGILSPDSIQSTSVVYEWHNVVLLQQGEPFFVYFRKCEKERFKQLEQYQIPKNSLVEDDTHVTTVWDDKSNEINAILDEITQRLDGIADLRGYYDILTRQGEDYKLQQAAADKLGQAPEDLSLAATNYLIVALNFWLESTDRYGLVLKSIADALGRLGKRKATLSLVRLLVKQPDLLDAVSNALTNLSDDTSLV